MEVQKCVLTVYTGLSWTESSICLWKLWMWRPLEARADVPTCSFISSESESLSTSSSASSSKSSMWRKRDKMDEVSPVPWNWILTTQWLILLFLINKGLILKGTISQHTPTLIGTCKSYTQRHRERYTVKSKLPHIEGGMSAEQNDTWIPFWVAPPNLQLCMQTTLPKFRDHIQAKFTIIQPLHWLPNFDKKGLIYNKRPQKASSATVARWYQWKICSVKGGQGWTALESSNTKTFTDIK